MKTVKISQKQAQEFVRVIFADIDAYVEAHKEEFEKCLRLEEIKEDDKD